MERSGNSLAGFAAGERMKFTSRRTPCRFTTARRSIACGWDAWARSGDPSGREIVLYRWQRYCAISRSAFGVLRKERCNGDSARRLGNDLLFSQLAEAGIENVKENVKTKLLSICRFTASTTIGTDWKEYGQSFEDRDITRNCSRRYQGAVARPDKR